MRWMYVFFPARRRQVTVGLEAFDSRNTHVCLLLTVYHPLGSPHSTNLFYERMSVPVSNVRTSLPCVTAAAVTSGSSLLECVNPPCPLPAFSTAPSHNSRLLCEKHVGCTASQLSLLARHARFLMELILKTGARRSI